MRIVEIPDLIPWSLHPLIPVSNDEKTRETSYIYHNQTYLKPHLCYVNNSPLFKTMSFSTTLALRITNI